MTELPHGSVTFVFTDIAGSTRLWNQFPEAMPRAYTRHDAILRSAAANHGGVVTTIVGDAFHIAFASAPAAAAATLEAQHALHCEQWDTCGLPEALAVRMAIHIGTVTPNDEGDYRAPFLMHLDRLLAAAHGGQILLTTAVYGLIWDSLPVGATLRDLGEQWLKEIDQPSQIYQVTHSALPAEFPPLRTLRQRPTNLPAPPTALHGREDESEAVAALLRQPSVRLVTLTGPGGIGKTRLALSAAKRLLDDFPDGVWFVELAAIVDPDLVPEAITASLRLRLSSSASLASLRAHLELRRALLVLDNFEQVQAAATMLNALLLGCPELCILVTSRSALHLRAEQEFPVSPLALPRRQPPPSLEQISRCDAVRLFIERAQAVRPDFTLDHASAPIVAEICARLDGLPLAIELAAARVRLLDPAAMLARLERRLPLLTGGARDLPERQRTLRQALAWSYDLLPPDEQALFCLLAGFTGGFTLEAAEAVAADCLDVDVLTGVERLVEQSLVRQTAPLASRPRFGMLETIREFGLEQRAENPQEDASARRAHAGYYADLITRTRRVTSIADPDGIAEMIAERDNIRAMLHFLLETGDAETALRVTMRLTEHWTFTGGQFKDGRTRIEQALAGQEAAHPETRAYALYGLAMIATHQGDHKAARVAAEESLALARTGNDPGAVIGALFWLSSGYAFGGQIQDAIACIQEATRLARETGHDDWLIWTLWLHGMARIVTGELELSRSSLHEGLALARQRRDPWGEAATLMVLGLNSGDAGELELAAEQHAASLERYRALGAGIGVPYSFVGLADVAITSCQPDAAAWLLGAGEGHFDRFGYRAPPGLSRRANRIEAAVMSALGSQEAARLMAHGRALTSTDAVAGAIAFARALTDAAVTLPA